MSVLLFSSFLSLSSSSLPGSSLLFLSLSSLFNDELQCKVVMPVDVDDRARDGDAGGGDIELFTLMPPKLVGNGRGDDARRLELAAAVEREGELGEKDLGHGGSGKKRGNGRGGIGAVIYRQRRKSSGRTREDLAADWLEFAGKIGDEIRFESTQYSTGFAPILEGKERGG
jgi:hypothetical protein